MTYTYKGINEKILREIKENIEDKVLQEFLRELIYEEAEHPGLWQYKDIYKKKLCKYAERGEILDEN